MPANRRFQACSLYYRFHRSHFGGACHFKVTQISFSETSRNILKHPENQTTFLGFSVKLVYPAFIACITSFHSDPYFPPGNNRNTQWVSKHLSLSLKSVSKHFVYHRFTGVILCPETSRNILKHPENQATFSFEFSMKWVSKHL